MHGLDRYPVTVNATDLVLDRLPPLAELSLGMPVHADAEADVPRDRLQRVLARTTYQPDAFFDYEPHLEYLPNPYEGFRAYLSRDVSVLRFRPRP